MPQFLKWSLAGLAIFSAAIAGVGTLRDTPPGPQRAPAGNAITEAQISSLLFRPEEKQRYIYRFSRKIAFRGLDNKIPDVIYHGELTLDVLHSGPDGFDAIAGERVAEQPSGNPFFSRIHLSADGKRLELFIEALSSEEDSERLNILRDLLANWAFPLESDTVGNFSGHFQIVSQTPSLKAKKEKIAYLISSPAVPEILHSEHSLLWNEALKMPQEILGEEETRLGKAPTAIVARSEYSIEFWKKELFSNSNPLRFAEAAALTLSSDPKAMENPENYKIRWDALLGDLQDIAGKTGGEQLRIFGDLAKYLKLHPENLGKALALLGPDALAAGPKSELFQAIVGALATAGSPAAQAALLRLYQDAGASVPAKGAILSALTTTQAELTPETRQFLLGEMQHQGNSDLANGAGFALGSAIQNAPSDATTEAAVQSVQDSWRQASLAGDEARELNLLDIMGNSGRADFLADIQAVAQSPGDSELRARAVFSLRFVPGALSVNLLNSSLSDPDAMVRAAAARAMQVAPWQEAFRAPLQNCASHESVGGVQAICQAVLAQANMVAQK